MRNRYLWILVLLLLGLGAGIRLYDLTDPPLATRQLHGAVIARGMYYQMMPNADPQVRGPAIAFWKASTLYEPPILERLVALTYMLIGREEIWIARLYNSLFWVAGGVVLFALALRMYASDAPAWTLKLASLAALAYYLLQPYAVENSRAFQVDPGMVVWSIFALYTLYLWAEKRAWVFAILGGLLSGIAILVKVTAIHMLAPAFLALVIVDIGLKRAWRVLQVWIIALLMIAPTLVYTFLNSQLGQASTYFQNTTLALLHLATKPAFYVSWLYFLQTLISFPILLLGFAGMLISPARGRAFLLGIWIGYVLYGITFPHQIGTHAYYHLRLVPIVALSLVPLIQLLLVRVQPLSWAWKLGFAALALLAIAYPLWYSYFQLSKYDQRPEAARMQEIGAQLPGDGKILAVTEEYGFPLMYYGWRKVYLWPTQSEQELKALRGNPKEFDHLFDKHTQGKDYFLVTNLKEFERQPDLREKLFEHYPLVIDDEDFLLFALTPKPGSTGP